MCLWLCRWERNYYRIIFSLSKAFDTVDHDILRKKLQEFNIRDNALNWFKSYLENRKQVVEITYIDNKTGIINNKLASEKPIKYGVPRGSTLGLVLFLLYIKDLDFLSTHTK